MNIYGGIEIAPSPFLNGCKRGIKCGNRVTVSEAFYSLVQSEPAEKLADLLKSLTIVEIPRSTSFPVLTE